MILTIIGIGLIGGSMAMELRQKKFCNKIIGVDLNKEHQKKETGISFDIELLKLH